MIRRAPEIERLFPNHDVAAFSTDSLLDEPELYPEELDFIERAVEGRRAEFAAGRACARRAIAAVGGPTMALPVGEGRQPVWPQGITAAITHTRREGREFVAAVAALNGDGSIAIGVDAEVIQPLKDGVREMLLVDSEIHAVESLPADLQETAAIRVFSAKEAFYKAQYSLTNGWVGFSDMMLDSLSGSGSLVQTGDLEVLRGVRTPVPFRQALVDGLVVSGVTVERT